MSLVPESPVDNPPHPEPEPEPEPEHASAPSIPAHRLRAANPRVRAMDDPNLTEVVGPEAIAVKARFMKHAANGEAKEITSSSSRPARVSSSRAGPGKSSRMISTEINSTRLTMQNGVLASVRPTRANKQSNSTAGVEPHDDASHAAESSLAGSAVAVEVVEQVVAQPEPTPTGEELLKAAGMNDEAAQGLPDFEDGAGDGEPEPQSAIEVQNEL